MITLWLCSIAAAWQPVWEMEDWCKDGRHQSFIQSNNFMLEVIHFTTAAKESQSVASSSNVITQKLRSGDYAAPSPSRCLLGWWSGLKQQVGRHGGKQSHRCHREKWEILQFNPCKLMVHFVLFTSPIIFMKVETSLSFNGLEKAAKLRVYVQDMRLGCEGVWCTAANITCWMSSQASSHLLQRHEICISIPNWSQVIAISNIIAKVSVVKRYTKRTNH